MEKKPDFKAYFEKPLDAMDGAKRFLDGLGGNRIASTAKISEYTIIEPPCYIGENSRIGPFAHIRPYTFVGDDCHVGPFSQIKASIILDGTKVPHLDYVGDSIIGKKCNLGAGTKIANLRFDGKNVRITQDGERIDSGRRKLGAIVGDNVEFGINTSVMPGVKIGSGCRVGAGVVVDRDLEENVFYGFKNGLLVKQKIKGE